MNYQKLSAIGSTNIAFITFLVGLMAVIYYLSSLIEMNLSQIFLSGIIYTKWIVRL